MSDFLGAIAAQLDAEPDAGAIYEPWVPVVGQRVRVHLSGECRITWVDGSLAARQGRVGHYPGEDGLVGTVRGIDPVDTSLGRQGHFYEVHFRGGVRDLGNGGRGCCVNYAASELIPIDDAAGAEGEGRG